MFGFECRLRGYSAFPGDLFLYEMDEKVLMTELWTFLYAVDGLS